VIMCFETVTVSVKLVVKARL